MPVSQLARLDRAAALVAQCGPATATAAGLDPGGIESSHEVWLRALFARYLQDPLGRAIPLAAHHHEFWAWVWALERGATPRPFVGVWPRNGGKSTSVEMACVAVGARGTRKYVLYVCETQQQADDHVQNIAAMLESPAVGQFYPRMAERLVGKYGNSKGWRRSRLRTASGFTVDALGLDTAARGVKLDEARPDLIVLDDLDDPLDTPATVQRKVTAITRSLLPAGSADAGVVGVQNLIHAGGIFAQLIDGRADFLAGRIVSGPHKALEGLAHEQRDGRFVLVAGTPTWAGLDLARCQQLVDRFGISAFLSESQHEVQEPDGGMFSHLTYRHCTREEVPDLVTVAVWVDPAVTDTDQSDACGIQADGVDASGTLYRLRSWERRASPLEALRAALRIAVEVGASSVGVETDQGGDTWQSVYREAWASLVRDGEVDAAKKPPSFRHQKAGASQMSKTERAGRMLAQGYEAGKIVHVLGDHELLERALRRFPLKKPFDLVDAAYWSWKALAAPDPRLAVMGKSVPLHLAIGPSRQAPMATPRLLSNGEEVLLPANAWRD